MAKKDFRRVAIINSVPDQSTGKIAVGLYEYFQKKGIPSLFCYGSGESGRKKGYYKIDYKIEYYIHVLLCRLSGFQGYFSKKATQRLIMLFKKLKIDTVYAVNLHGYYLNEKLLFEYMKQEDIKFVYIMADEYAFCGKCGYRQDCNKYERGCGNCSQIREYPKSLFFDRTKEIFEMKKKAYRQLKNPVFVGPEYTIKQSQKSPLMEGIFTEIIDEAVNTDFYTPRNVLGLRKRLSINEKKIVCVCVAPSNYERKGTKYFIELAKYFENNTKYIFIHVGYVGKNQNLPLNYIAIGYESDQEKLAQYYSIGDLFVFPSLLDTMPNACLEALSCGTPLLCFNISGMPYIGDNSVMSLVEAGNVDQMAKVVERTQKKTKAIIDTCRNYAISRYSYPKYFNLLDKASERI